MPARPTCPRLSSLLPRLAGLLALLAGPGVASAEDGPDAGLHALFPARRDGVGNTTRFPRHLRLLVSERLAGLAEGERAVDETLRRILATAEVPVQRPDEAQTGSTLSVTVVGARTASQPAGTVQLTVRLAVAGALDSPPRTLRLEAAADASASAAADYRRAFLDPRCLAALAQLLCPPGRDAADLLAPSLRDADPLVRRAAAAGLGQLRTPAAIDALMAALADGEEARRRDAQAALVSVAGRDLGPSVDAWRRWRAEAAAPPKTTPVPDK